MATETIIVVDDDADVRESLTVLLESAGFKVSAFAAAAEFLAQDAKAAGACAIVDIRMPDMDGLALQREMKKRGIPIPVIIVTGHGDVPLAVKAIQAGAVDFIEKPYDQTHLLQSIGRALDMTRQQRQRTHTAQDAAERLASLTPREREVLQLIASGHPNKVVAQKLDISPRTVEVHRARLMDKTQAGSVSDLVRWAMAAGLLSD